MWWRPVRSGLRRQPASLISQGSGSTSHGGIARGIDYIVMPLCGEENLRVVVLFPMNQRAEDLTMGAPSEVLPKQLRELDIRVVKPN
jgi:aspartyl-tRNA synthetase